MKAVTMIIGRNRSCYHCGVPLQTVLIPAVSDRWLMAEPFEPGSEVIKLHDCEQHPSRERVTADHVGAR
jgi:hypothetical protein